MNDTTDYYAKQSPFPVATIRECTATPIYDATLEDALNNLGPAEGDVFEMLAAMDERTTPARAVTA